jgi:hypothetical protein
MSDAEQATYQRAVANVGRLLALQYTFFPGRKAYAPIFDSKVTVEGRRFLGEAVFVHERRGPFQIGVVCGKAIGNPMEYVGRVSASIALALESDGPAHELTREFSLGEAVWWDGPMRNGFTLGYYGVPLDVRPKSPIRCRITVDDFEGALSKYKPVSFYSRFAWIP